MIGDEKETAILTDGEGRTVRGQFLIKDDGDSEKVELTLIYPGGAVTGTG
jgi:hypothetical protein